MVHFILQTILIWPSEDNSSKFSNFDQCHPNVTSLNSATYLSDYLSEDQVFWKYWMWIFPVLCLMQLILRKLDDNGKITIITKVFGPGVSVDEFIRGPILSDDHSLSHV